MSAADKIAEALAALEELANMPLGISLADWSRLSSPILESLREQAPADLADAQAQEIARLQGALGFYANPENWKGDEEAWERADNGDDDPETLEAMLSSVELDGGKIARTALGNSP